MQYATDIAPSPNAFQAVKLEFVSSLKLALIKNITTHWTLSYCHSLRSGGCWLLPCPRRVCQCPSLFGARPLGHFLETGLLLPPLAALRRFPRLSSH